MPPFVRKLAKRPPQKGMLPHKGFDHFSTKGGKKTPPLAAKKHGSPAPSCAGKLTRALRQNPRQKERNHMRVHLVQKWTQNHASRIGKADFHNDFRLGLPPIHLPGCSARFICGKRRSPSPEGGRNKANSVDLPKQKITRQRVKRIKGPGPIFHTDSKGPRSPRSRTPKRTKPAFPNFCNVPSVPCSQKLTECPILHPSSARFLQFGTSCSR